jgi:hypothetical protein
MTTKKEIQDQIDALTASLDDADDDDVELLVEHPRTKAVGRLRGAHAQSFLASILGDDDDQDDGKGKGKGKTKKKAGADDDDQDDDDVDDDDPPKRQSVWGRK